MRLFLAQEFHDIAPPFDSSLIPTWMVSAGSFLVLAVLGLIGWLIWRRLRKPKPEQTPRARALELLRSVRGEITQLTPYQFSIRVSDILRQFVLQQYQLPVTRQTSVEFLESLGNAPQFTEADKSLLGDFLTRCDLIKFARYEATESDSELLLEEATRFVEGGKLEPVA